MEKTTGNHFDAAAAEWDNNPVRVRLAEAVGQAIARQVPLAPDMDVLDYGCGTGLLGLFLRPHVGSVTGADSSAGMLDVLQQKIAAGNLERMHTLRLDLEKDALPAQRFHLIATNMTLHHVENTPVVLRSFHALLHPGGRVAIADLDTEPGIFHGPDPQSAGVRHFGFDREEMNARLVQAGFIDPQAVTAHVVRRPIEGRGETDFPVFLITARRPA